MPYKRHGKKGACFNFTYCFRIQLTHNPTVFYCDQHVSKSKMCQSFPQFVRMYVWDTVFTVGFWSLSHTYATLTNGEAPSLEYFILISARKMVTFWKKETKNAQENIYNRQRPSLHATSRHIHVTKLKTKINSANMKINEGAKKQTNPIFGTIFPHFCCFGNQQFVNIHHAWLLWSIFKYHSLIFKLFLEQLIL
jgi:hypothetical protein